MSNKHKTKGRARAARGPSAARPAKTPSALHSPNRPGSRRPKRRAGFSRGTWIGLGAVGVAVVGLLVLGGGDEGSGGRLEAGSAPAFSLASTSGEQVSLSDFKGRDVLLYFSEGVGCDPCFTQMRELEAHNSHLQEEGLTVVPIVVNGADDVHMEMERFGLQTDFLIDPDKGVSDAYDTLGTGHHAELPGHSFVFVDGQGEIRWREDYASMFVAPDDLISSVASARA